MIIAMNQCIRNKCALYGQNLCPDKIIDECNEAPYWAGCNHYINQGKVPIEPKGTGTSMHDCMSCEELASCPDRKDAPVWYIEKHNFQ